MSLNTDFQQIKFWMTINGFLSFFEDHCIKCRTIIPSVIFGSMALFWDLPIFSCAYVQPIYREGRSKTSLLNGAGIISNDGTDNNLVRNNRGDGEEVGSKVACRVAHAFEL